MRIGARERFALLGSATFLSVATAVTTLVASAVVARSAELPVDFILASGATSENLVLFNVPARTAQPFVDPGIIVAAMGADVLFDPTIVYAVSGLGPTVDIFNRRGVLLDRFETPNHPSGIAITRENTLLVTLFGDLNMKTFINEDPDNRIIEYTDRGEELRTFEVDGMLGPSGITYDSTNDTFWVVASNTGEPGGDGQAVYQIDRESGRTLTVLRSEELSAPLGVALTSRGHVLVTSFYTDSIVEFTPDGEVAQLLRAEGLRGPTYLQVDSADNIYVSSLLTDELLVLSPDGEVIDSFRSPDLDGPYGIKLVELSSDAERAAWEARGLTAR